VRITGRLRTLEPLRVGMGRVDTPDVTTDLPVIRVKELRSGIEVPYIPGSSLKGVFRSAAESIAKSEGVKPDPCSGLSKNNCMAARRVEGQTLEDFVKTLLRKNAIRDALKSFADNACLLCKVFGAPTYRSKVVFEDAYPVDEGGKLTSVPTGIKMGIAIDRTTGAVATGALYRVEYVEPGALFSFSFNSTNLPNYALGLLAEVFTLLDDGLIRVGGFKSRGFGRVRADDVSLMVRHYSPISGEAGRLDTLGDPGDRSVSLTPSDVRDEWVIFRGPELEALLKELRRVWKDYAASASKR
ncbi:MAG: CRISPR-associated RAMP protein Csx7, partial [Nitrososphaerota archaeon]